MDLGQVLNPVDWTGDSGTRAGLACVSTGRRPSPSSTRAPANLSCMQKRHPSIWHRTSTDDVDKAPVHRYRTHPPMPFMNSSKWQRRQHGSCVGIDSRAFPRARCLLISQPTDSLSSTLLYYISTWPSRCAVVVSSQVTDEPVCIVFFFTIVFRGGQRPSCPRAKPPRGATLSDLRPPSMRSLDKHSLLHSRSLCHNHRANFGGGWGGWGRGRRGGREKDRHHDPGFALVAFYRRITKLQMIRGH